MSRRFLLGFVLLALGIACTASSATSEEGLCSPNKASYCRCLDRREGQKVCLEDGSKWGPCEPCESFDNPEIPFEPGPDEPAPDAGRDGGTCGNGTVESGEACDVKNAVAANGCNKSCALSGPTPFASNACPGLPVHVWGGAHKPTLQSTTVGSGKRSVTASCGTVRATGFTGPDRVFDVVPHANGKLVVEVADADYDVFLYAADTCDIDKVTAKACANETDGVGGERLVVPVTSGTRVHVFVDGTGSTANAGNFRVTFSIDP